MNRVSIRWSREATIEVAPGRWRSVFLEATQAVRVEFASGDVVVAVLPVGGHALRDDAVYVNRVLMPAIQQAHAEGHSIVEMPDYGVTQ